MAWGQSRKRLTQATVERAAKERDARSQLYDEEA
jgi:hypothetical protein